jgi:hypothetical protein
MEIKGENPTMKMFVLLVASVSVVHAAGGAAPGSAKAWEEDQARRAAASRFDSSSLKGPRPPTEIRFGTEQAWFVDWNLSTDRSPSGPIDRAAIRRGAPRFLGIFDERGWITELRYMDARGNHRWSRIFTYKMPVKGSTDTSIAFVSGFYDPKGDPLERDDAEKNVRDNGRGWATGHTRYEVRDALGEALMNFPTTDGGETWVYFDGKDEIKFTFDKQGKLVESTPRR